MICHLNYTIEKSYYKKYFFDNYDKGDWHRRGDKVLKIWWKMFDIDEVVKPITYDLGIEKLNIKPRFSYQLPNTSLMSHIDEDRIVAINLNLFEETPEMFLRAARHAELDIMTGVSANVMCGQEGYFGTGYFQVLLDLQKMAELGRKSLESKKNINKLLGINDQEGGCSIKNI